MLAAYWLDVQDRQDLSFRGRVAWSVGTFIFRHGAALRLAGRSGLADLPTGRSLPAGHRAGALLRLRLWPAHLVVGRHRAGKEDRAERGQKHTTGAAGAGFCPSPSNRFPLQSPPQIVPGATGEDAPPLAVGEPGTARSATLSGGNLDSIRQGPTLDHSSTANSYRTSDAKSLVIKSQTHSGSPVTPRRRRAASASSSVNPTQLQAKARDTGNRLIVAAMAEAAPAASRGTHGPVTPRPMPQFRRASAMRPIIGQ